MPIFDFSCTHCGRRFEALVKSDCNVQECPVCKYDAIKVPSVFAFKVKGHNAENGYCRKPSLVDNPPR